MAARDTVICECRQVRLDTLQMCIARGCSTVDALARETGATTVCGGCIPRVAELVSEEHGIPARIAGVRRHSASVWSFRLEPQDPTATALEAALPGQHVVVSGLVGDRWVTRPYTLTSPGGARPFREITVKLEQGGELSPWLFGRGRDFTALRITQPRGDFWIDLNRPEPVVFLAGGIGITPAISMARTLVAQRGDRRLHIDYSARSPDGFVFRDELSRLAESYPNISVRFRVTGSGDRLGPADLSGFHHALPEAVYYLCGPDGYQATARSGLLAAGVSPARVHQERFRVDRVETPAPAAAAAPRPLPWRRSDLLLLLVGAVLLGGYLVQGALGWQWPALAELQQQESYRRWSGAVLLAFVAAQWLLPGLRLRGNFGAAGRAYPWHRWVGVLAPVFFYAHAASTGYGYLLALSSVYLANIAVGLVDKTVVRNPQRRERYARVWMIPHVALAILTVVLALFHLYVVFAYQ